MIVPHGFCLPDPGLPEFRSVWTLGGSLGPVERRVEGVPRGATSACDSGGLVESLPPWWVVPRVHFQGVGLGRREEPMCRVEDPPLGICFEMWTAGCWGGASRVSHGATAISIPEGWRCEVALRRRG